MSFRRCNRSYLPKHGFLINSQQFLQYFSYCLSVSELIWWHHRSQKSKYRKIRWSRLEKWSLHSRTKSMYNSHDNVIWSDNLKHPIWKSQRSILRSSPNVKRWCSLSIHQIQTSISNFQHMTENKAQEVSLDDLETENENSIDTPEKSFRFGKLPDWTFFGWQFTFFFGKHADPEVPLSLQRGWNSLIIGVFKLKYLPEEGAAITSENVSGGIVQLQVWLPFDNFGKL